MKQHNEWLEQAACVTHDPEAFFRAHQTDEVLAVCHLSCPVVRQCLKTTLREEPRAGTFGGPYGVCGGLTANARDAIYRTKDPVERAAAVEYHFARTSLRVLRRQESAA